MDEKPSKSTAIYWLFGGGFGVSILAICSIGALAICFISVFGDPHPTKFVGSWKGRFHLPGGVVDIVYTFNKDGSFTQDTFGLDGRKNDHYQGTWGARGDRLMITFSTRNQERADVTWIDQDSFTYRIVEQADPRQIGLTTTFKRL